MQTKKSLKVFLALLIVVSVLAWLNETALMAVHGFSQSIFEGNSTGKTMLMLGWFIGNSALSLGLLKSGLSKKLEQFELISLKAFGALVFIGLLLGTMFYGLAILEFRSRGPFATMIQTNEYSNWEGSSLNHNHFQKMALYPLLKLLGFQESNAYDDGFPWFQFFGENHLLAAVLLVPLIGAFIAGIIHLNCIAGKKGFFDYLLFLFASLGLSIGIIDGGVGAIIVVINLWFFLLYLSRNYLHFKNELLGVFFPLIAVSVVSFADIITGLQLSQSLHAISFVLFFNVLYFLVLRFKAGKLNFSPKNIGLVLGFLVLLLIVGSYYFVYSFGAVIEEKPLSSYFTKSIGGAGLYIYGLPRQTSEAELDEVLTEYGEIIELSKVNWVAYARIAPHNAFRARELEKRLKQEFNPSTYLFVENANPVMQSNEFEIQWFEDVNPTDFLDSEFLDLKVLSIEHNEKNNSTTLVVLGKTQWRWQMLSVLTEIREKGFQGNLLLVNT